MRVSFFMTSYLVLCGLAVGVLSCVDVPTAVPKENVNKISSKIAGNRNEELSGEARIFNDIFQALSWIERWRVEIISCPEGDPNQEPVLAGELFAKFKGQEIDLLIKDSNKYLFVDLIQLKTSLQFPKINDAPVIPPYVSFFCESPLLREGDFIRQKFRFDPDAITSAGKQDSVYDQLLSKIKNAAADFVHKSCINPEPAKRPKINRKRRPVVKVVIPSFSVGDPEIYVLFERKDTIEPDGHSIVWFRFVRNPENGEIDVLAVKNFGLSIETKRFIDLIRRYQIEELALPCRDG